MSDMQCEINNNGGVDLQNGGAQESQGAMGALFGMTELLTKNGKVSATEVLAEKRAIGLYFSAHWCPPCRQFTPILSAFYRDAKQDDVEIIFLSSDRDQSAFEEYYADMPWVALPFEQREKKKELADMFDVSGIPAFIIVDSEGNIKSLEGRSDVMNCVGGVMRARFGDKKESEITEEDVKLEFTDEEASAFKTTMTEWIEKDVYTKPEFYGIEELLRGSDMNAVAEVRESAKAFAFYFSASWCPPCRMFTPQLVEFYNNTREIGLEIIFVGLDRTEKDHNAYFAKMPWLAVPWYGENSDRADPRDVLTKEFRIRGIPHLAITKPDGTIIDAQGKQKVADLVSKNASVEEMKDLANQWVAKCE